MNFGGKTLAERKNIITVIIRNYRYAISHPPGNYFLHLSADKFKFGLIINFPRSESTLLYWARAEINFYSDGSVSTESNIDLRPLENLDCLSKNTAFICQPIIGKKNILRDIFIKNLDLVLEKIVINK